MARPPGRTWAFRADHAEAANLGPAIWPETARSAGGDLKSGHSSHTFSVSLSSHSPRPKSESQHAATDVDTSDLSVRHDALRAPGHRRPCAGAGPGRVRSRCDVSHRPTAGALDRADRVASVRDGRVSRPGIERYTVG